MNLFMTQAKLAYDQDIVGIVMILLLLIVVAILCAMPYINWFRQELKYINTEIQRNAEHPREQARWKRRKKRLLKSLLPFVKYE